MANSVCPSLTVLTLARGLENEFLSTEQASEHMRETAKVIIPSSPFVSFFQWKIHDLCDPQPKTIAQGSV